MYNNTFNFNTKSQLSSSYRYKRIKNYLYDTEMPLGKGNFSTVYRATQQNSNEQLAIKVVKLNSLTFKKLEELLEQQINIICELSHPNIIRCQEVLKSSNHCYFITELCEQGNLQKTLNEKGVLREEDVWPYVRDIYQGLKYLSAQNIIHRDIKTANIFLKHGVAKIADFGFATRSRGSFNDMNIGSPLYMSPEGFIDNVYGPKTDVWAFGVVIYELLHGVTPFHQSFTETELKTSLMVPLSAERIRSDISLELRQLILRCMQIDQNQRISIEDIQKLPYFQRNIFAFTYSNRPQTASFMRTSGSNSKNGRRTDSQIAIIPRIAQNNSVEKENLHFKKHHYIKKHLNEKLNKSDQSHRTIIDLSKKNDSSILIDLQNKQLIRGCLTFNESIGLIHFCRIGFKLMQQQDNDQLNGLIKALIIKILIQLLTKVNLKMVTYDLKENKQAKQNKLKLVAKEYLAKYQSFYVSKADVIDILRTQQLVSQSLRCSEKQNQNILKSYLSMIFLIFAQFLRWGINRYNYQIFAQNGVIDTCLQQKNIPTTMGQYLQLKTKYMNTFTC